jgi:hypothetical protein
MAAKMVTTNNTISPPLQRKQLTDKDIGGALY